MLKLQANNHGDVGLENCVAVAGARFGKGGQRCQRFLPVLIKQVTMGKGPLRLLSTSSTFHLPFHSQLLSFQLTLPHRSLVRPTFPTRPLSPTNAVHYKYDTGGNIRLPAANHGSKVSLSASAKRLSWL